MVVTITYTELITTSLARDRLIMFCLSDFEEHARKVLPKNAWDYYSSGANQEHSLRDSTEAFSRYRRCLIVLGGVQ